MAISNTQAAINIIKGYGVLVKIYKFFIKLIFLMLMIIYVECKNFVYASETIGGVCGLEYFNEFIDEFSKSIDFQKSHILFPLQKMYINNSADPEPIPMEILLDYEEIIYPIFPKFEEIYLADRYLNLNVLQKNAEVNVGKEDTDYLLKFFFKNDGCWKLFRIEDWSL